MAYLWLDARSRAAYRERRFRQLGSHSGCGPRTGGARFWASPSKVQAKPRCSSRTNSCALYINGPLKLIIADEHKGLKGATAKVLVPYDPALSSATSCAIPDERLRRQEGPIVTAALQAPGLRSGPAGDSPNTGPS